MSVALPFLGPNPQDWGTIMASRYVDDYPLDFDRLIEITEEVLDYWDSDKKDTSGGALWFVRTDFYEQGKLDSKIIVSNVIKSHGNHTFFNCIAWRY